LPEILLSLALIREARAEPARQFLPLGEHADRTAGADAVETLPPGAHPPRRVLLARQEEEQFRGDPQVLTDLVEEEVAAAGAARHAEGTARVRPCQLLDFLADGRACRGLLVRREVRGGPLRVQGVAAEEEDRGGRWRGLFPGPGGVPGRLRLPDLL